MAMLEELCQGQNCRKRRQRGNKSVAFQTHQPNKVMLRVRVYTKETLTTNSLLGKILDIHVCVIGQLLQHWLHFCLQGTGDKHRAGISKAAFTSSIATCCFSTCLIELGTLEVFCLLSHYMLD